jgi:hypothetical protein
VASLGGDDVPSRDNLDDEGLRGGNPGDVGLDLGNNVEDRDEDNSGGGDGILGREDLDDLEDDKAGNVGDGALVFLEEENSVGDRGRRSAGGGEGDGLNREDLDALDSPKGGRGGGDGARGLGSYSVGEREGNAGGGDNGLERDDLDGLLPSGGSKGDRGLVVDKKVGDDGRNARGGESLLNDGNGGGGDDPSGGSPRFEDRLGANDRDEVEKLLLPVGRSKPRRELRELCRLSSSSSRWRCRSVTIKLGWVDTGFWT